MAIDKDEPGLCKNIQDPQELYNSIGYQTGPGKTFHDHTEPKRIIP